MGLGLLAMGDIAVACGAGAPQIASSSAGPPAVPFPSAVFCRGGGSDVPACRASAGQRAAGKISGSDGVGESSTMAVPELGFVAAPAQVGFGGGGGGSSRRRGMMRRRSRAAAVVTAVAPRPPSSSSTGSTAAFALPPASTTMLSTPNDQQQLPDEQRQEQEQGRAFPAGMSTGLQAAGAMMPASAAAPVSNGAVNGVAAGVSTGVPRTPEGVSTAVAVGGSRRLGVIRPAELGDMRAKRAKVKVRWWERLGTERRGKTSCEGGKILDNGDGGRRGRLVRNRGGGRDRPVGWDIAVPRAEIGKRGAENSRHHKRRPLYRWREQP